MIRLLLVDDEPVTRKGLLKFIPWNTFGVDSVESAADGAEAVETAARFRPDIVISDIKMPKMTGVEFAKRLKQLLPGCRVIFLSAYADKSNLKHAIDLRVDKFLEKPIKRDELMLAVQNLAAEIEAERASESAQRRKMAKSLRLARQKLALELVSSDGAGLRPDHVALADVDMLYYPHVTSMAARFGCKGDPDLPRQCEDALYDGLESWFSGSGVCICGFTSPRDLAIHTFTQEKPVWAAVTEPLRALKREAEEAAGAEMPVFLGIGPTVEDLTDVRKSFTHAREALKELFYMGYDGAAVYEPAAQRASPPAGMAQAFSARLKEYDPEGACSFLGNFANGVRVARSSPDSVRKELTQFVGSVEKMSRDFGLPPQRTDALKRAVGEADTLSEIQEAFYQVITEDFKGIDTNKNLGYIVSRVKTLIDSQYSDSELSIKSLCRQVYLSETYLCDVYKKKTGETINSRITAVRMEKAKELLKNDLIKITLISGMVGYTSSDYFTKLFRKHTGMNPSEFRDSCSAPVKKGD